MGSLKIYLLKYSKYLIIVCFLFSKPSANGQVTCSANFCYEAVLDSIGNICVTYHNFSTSNDSITQYVWDFGCEGISSSIFEPTICLPISSCPPGTTYTELHIQTFNGCVNTYGDTIFLGSTCPTSINEINTEEKELFALYPNPANNEINIVFPDSEVSANITLCSTYGQILITEKISSAKKTIDISLLPKGLYILTISVKENIFTKIIIKE